MRIFYSQALSVSYFFFLTLFFFLLTGLKLASQTPGEVSPYLVCNNNKKHSYALYLPSNYRPDREWPVLFLYSASGNGMAGIDKFKPAAEKYGYILVGSHNYRNGPMNIGYEAASILFEDITHRYPVDMKRIYTGGMSGGARMATTMAVVNNEIAGVIAIGASYNFLQAPTAKNNFTFIGVAGDKDMNYLELVKATREIRSLGIKSHMITYDGKHRWCEEPQATEALQWIEIHAIKKGLKSDITGFSSFFLSQQLKKASELERTLKLTAAKKLYESLLLFYGSEVSEQLISRISTLERQKAFKKQNRKLAHILAKESDEQKLIRHGFGNIQQVMKSDSVYHWWQTRTSSWRKQQKNGKTPEARNSATRSLGFVGLFAFSTASPHMSAGKWIEAIPYLKVATLINPNDPDVNYFMSKVYAITGDQRASKKHQKKALSGGFTREDGSSDISEEKLLDTQEFEWLRWRVLNIWL